MDRKTSVLCRRVHQEYIGERWVPIADSHHTYDERITNEEYLRMVSLESIRFFQSLGSVQVVQFNERGKIDFLASYAPHSNDERIVYYFFFEG